MLDEDKLKTKIGTENPFLVPEGYFEAFQKGLLNNLPERISEPVRIRPSIWTRYRPFVAVAACICGIALLIGGIHVADNSKVASFAEADDFLYSEEDMDGYMATSFYNEYTFYSYLTNEDF